MFAKLLLLILVLTKPLVVYIMLNYDKDLAVTETSGTNSLADSSKDKKIIMQHLLPEC